MDCIKNSSNLNLLWCNIIIEELVRHKINYFCISPGSRSTPLTVAAARHKKVISHIMYDERGAAYHALGYGRATKKPAVLICTSGTAVANYYPAIIEAFQENIPLIVLSADRPPELRGRGANQTIDQVNIFGKYTAYFKDLPCPSAEYKTTFVLQEINKAVQKCHANSDGPAPVHINCMFREPLAPLQEPWPSDYINDISQWLDSDKSFTRVKKTLPRRSAEISNLIKWINENTKAILVVGRVENMDDQQAILDLAEETGWPVFCDITSGLRLNGDSDKIIHFYDQLLLSGKLTKTITDVPILHFGGQLVSKRLLKFLENHQAEHIQIIGTTKKIDPANSVTKRIHYPISALIKRILPKLNNKTTFHSTLQEYSRKVNTCISDFLLSRKKINEISAAVIVSRDIFNETALFIASSMPIRDMDMFGLPGDSHIHIAANRGASGIDGTIASALGFANGLKKPLTLIIGDLAFIHDLNSLSMLRECEQPVLIVLINNQGGGIFSFLPIADYKDVFEKNFATPHPYSFEKVAEMFGMKYFNPKTNQDFAHLYAQYQYSKKVTLIEIKTDRTENFELHKNLQQQIISHLP